MKIRLFTTLLLLLLITGCYLPISGRVIDAETNQPLEGAVVMVEWTKKHGVIDPSTESYKVVETVSDKEGKVRIGGCYSPFVQAPHVTVYKKGYVAWNNGYIFPSWDKREDFSWFKFGENVFKLEHFRPEYSYEKHVSFIRLSINESIKSESKTIIEKAFDWETNIALKERTNKVK